MQTDLSGYQTKKPSKTRKPDTRNSWHCFMLKSKKAYWVFRKQSTVNAWHCRFQGTGTIWFRVWRNRFRFEPRACTGEHPKKYSVVAAEILLKKYSAQKIFLEKPRFRLGYPKGGFWSRYEHHEAIGKSRWDSNVYVRNQEKHHNVSRINDMAQKSLASS